mgnify:CR=1 FL=1
MQPDLGQPLRRPQRYSLPTDIEYELSRVKCETIAAQQIKLEVAVCLQEWQRTIDLTTTLMSIPQISPAQRQTYIDLRHFLEDLQSRSAYPNFRVNFDDPRFPSQVSTDRCRAIQEKVTVNQATVDAVQPDAPGELLKLRGSEVED